MASSGFQRLVTFFVTTLLFSAVATALPVAAAKADAVLDSSFLPHLHIPTDFTLLMNLSFLP